MGTGAIIIGLSAMAFIWALMAAALLWIARFFVNKTRRLPLLYWVVAVIVSSVVHGLILFALPGYERSLPGSWLAVVKIFIAPVMLLSFFVWMFSAFAATSISRETD